MSDRSSPCDKVGELHLDGGDDRIGVIVKEQRSGIGHIFHNVH
jgi:hypothetical protein